MLDQIDVFDARVRERAFRLWQEAGSPENTAEEFWHRAREIEMREMDVTEKDLERASAKDSPEADAADFA